MISERNKNTAIGVSGFHCQFTIDLNRTLTPVIVNPYARRRTVAASESNNTVNNVATNSVVTDLTMGNQSQLCNGAIRKCKKRATKNKTKRVYKQNAIGGGVAFVAHLHCVVCKAIHLVSQGKNISIPYRAHDKRCRVNRKTKGLRKTLPSTTHQLTLFWEEG
jgi:hypothetical protein